MGLLVDVEVLFGVGIEEDEEGMEDVWGGFIVDDGCWVGIIKWILIWLFKFVLIVWELRNVDCVWWLMVMDVFWLVGIRV